MSKLSANDIVEVVMALTGEIEAYGSSGIDIERYENQDVLEDVIYKLVGKIYDNTFYANRVEESMKKIGKEAKMFLKELTEEYGEQK